MKKFSLLNFKFICSLIFFLVFTVSVHAYNQDTPNNKFGIHFAQPHLEDLQKSKELVNSNGGDWGYVTLVIQENDREKNKWQEIFDKMRELHLIPIIRLATVPEADKWRRPAKEDADSWVIFFDSLNWVVKDRYVILFNEPNHAAEWGGAVDAENYAEVAVTFAQKLKEKNPDFFIMLAGLDASAPSSNPDFEDEGIFLARVFNNETIGQWNNLLSGFASHSYPSPDFSGSPYAAGRGSIRTYEWELSYLKQLGVKNLPVFITETGWRRGDENKIADYFKTAFENVWLPDEKIVAVTPFVLDYQGEPFLNFSWKRFQDSNFYPQYYTVQSLAKIKGDPVQIEKGKMIFDLPKELVAHSSFHFTLKLKNEGQALWDKDFGYRLSLNQNESGSEQAESSSTPFEYFFSDLKNVKPFEEVEVDLYIKTNSLLGKQKVQIGLKKNGESILDREIWQFEVFPLPVLNFKTSLFPKLQSEGDDFELQIFNKNEEIIFKKKELRVKKGKGVIDKVKNIALGRRYRVVILKPYYLPRQGFITFRKGNNELKFERMLPFDFKPDGRFDLEDIWTLLKNPKLFTLLFP